MIQKFIFSLRGGFTLQNIKQEVIAELSEKVMREVSIEKPRLAIIYLKDDIGFKIINKILKNVPPRNTTYIAIKPAELPKIDITQDFEIHQDEFDIVWFPCRIPELSQYRFQAREKLKLWTGGIENLSENEIEIINLTTKEITRK